MFIEPNTGCTREFIQSINRRFDPILRIILNIAKNYLEFKNTNLKHIKKRKRILRHVGTCLMKCKRIKSIMSKSIFILIIKLTMKNFSTN